MSWLDDVIKKISENTGISKAGEQIEKYATKMMIAQDNLAHAATNTVTKARPEIERGLGQEVLNMATQSPQQMQMPGVANLMAQGKAMDQNVLAQQIAANSQGEFFGMPSIMPERSALEQTVQSQKNILGKVGDTIRSEGRMGTDKAGKGFGNDLYKFIQSIGYGMIDKPLGREANTWDYLGKTIGQIARLNEGSGLQAGQQIYEQPQERMKQEVQLSRAKRENLLPSYSQSQEKLATIAALKSGKYALKADWTGDLSRQDIKTLDDALTYVTYKGIDPNDPAILESLKRYPVVKNGKVVGKFAGFDTDGEILVE